MTTILRLLLPLALVVAAWIPSCSAGSFVPVPSIPEGPVVVATADPSGANASAGGPARVEAAVRWDAGGLGLVAPPDRAEAGAGASLPPEVREAASAFGLAVLLGYWGVLRFWLCQTLIWPLFSRIESARILQQEVRQRIFLFVRECPGASVSDVVRMCGVGWGTAVYHLHRLEAERLVASQRHRRCRRFFENGGGIANDAKSGYAELLDPASQRLANEVLQNPGAAQKDLCHATGLRPPAAHKRLARMIAARLLTRRRDAHRVRYFPTERLDVLLRFLDAAASPA